MDLRKGDRVRFLNEKGEGVVAGFNRDGLALVLMDDGFEIPYLPKYLVVVKHTGLPAAEAGTAQIASLALPEAMLYLGFSLESMNAGEAVVSVNVINRYEKALFCSVYYQEKDTYTLAGSGKVAVNGSLQFMKAKHADLVRWDRLYLQVMALPSKTTVLPEADGFYLKHQVPALVDPGVWPAHEGLPGRALLIPAWPNRRREQKDLTAKLTKPILPAKEDKTNWLLKERDGVYEVDLHIHELLESTRGMDNFQMISYQLNYFRKCLDEARIRNIRKFVAIHGVGKGKLRDEIRNLLKGEGVTCQDASFSRYGFGATEVIVRG